MIVFNIILLHRCFILEQPDRKHFLLNESSKYSQIINKILYCLVLKLFKFLLENIHLRQPKVSMAKLGFKNLSILVTNHTCRPTLDYCVFSVILKSLRHFSHTIRDFFFTKFEHQAWNNFFHCAIAFLTQPALQLDNFSATKRWRLVSRYKDMRRETGFEIRSMWFNLGKQSSFAEII